MTEKKSYYYSIKTDDTARSDQSHDDPFRQNNSEHTSIRTILSTLPSFRNPPARPEEKVTPPIPQSRNYGSRHPVAVSAEASTEKPPISSSFAATNPREGSGSSVRVNPSDSPRGLESLSTTPTIIPVPEESFISDAMSPGLLDSDISWARDPSVVVLAPPHQTQRQLPEPTPRLQPSPARSKLAKNLPHKPESSFRKLHALPTRAFPSVGDAALKYREIVYQTGIPQPIIVDAHSKSVPARSQKPVAVIASPHNGGPEVRDEGNNNKSAVTFAGPVEVHSFSPATSYAASKRSFAASAHEPPLSNSLPCETRSNGNQQSELSQLESSHHSNVPQELSQHTSGESPGWSSAPARKFDTTTRPSRAQCRRKSNEAQIPSRKPTEITAEMNNDKFAPWGPPPYTLSNMSAAKSVPQEEVRSIAQTPPPRSRVPSIQSDPPRPNLHPTTPQQPLAQDRPLGCQGRKMPLDEIPAVPSPTESLSYSYITGYSTKTPSIVAPPIAANLYSGHQGAVPAGKILMVESTRTVTSDANGRRNSTQARSDDLTSIRSHGDSRKSARESRWSDTVNSESGKSTRYEQQNDHLNSKPQCGRYEAQRRDYTSSTPPQSGHYERRSGDTHSLQSPARHTQPLLTDGTGNGQAIKCRPLTEATAIQADTSAKERQAPSSVRTEPLPVEPTKKGNLEPIRRYSPLQSTKVPVTPATRKSAGNEHVILPEPTSEVTEESSPYEKVVINPNIIERQASNHDFQIATPKFSRSPSPALAQEHWPRKPPVSIDDAIHIGLGSKFWKIPDKPRVQWLPVKSITKARMHTVYFSDIPDETVPLFRHPQVVEEVHFDGSISQRNFLRLISELLELHTIELHLSVLHHLHFDRISVKSIDLPMLKSFEISSSGFTEQDTRTYSMPLVYSNVNLILTLTFPALTYLSVSVPYDSDEEKHFMTSLWRFIINHRSTLQVFNVESPFPNMAQSGGGRFFPGIDPEVVAMDITGAKEVKLVSFHLFYFRKTGSTEFFRRFLKTQDSLEYIQFWCEGQDYYKFPYDVIKNNYYQLETLSLNVDVRSYVDPYSKVPVDFSVFRETPQLKVLALKGMLLDHVHPRHYLKIDIVNVGGLPKTMETIKLMNLNVDKDDIRLLAVEYKTLQSLYLDNVGTQGNLGITIDTIVTLLERASGSLERLEVFDSVNEASLYGRHENTAKGFRLIVRILLRKQSKPSLRAYRTPDDDFEIIYEEDDESPPNDTLNSNYEKDDVWAERELRTKSSVHGAGTRRLVSGVFKDTSKKSSKGSRRVSMESGSGPKKSVNKLYANDHLSNRSSGTIGWKSKGSAKRSKGSRRRKIKK